MQSESYLKGFSETLKQAGISEDVLQKVAFTGSSVGNFFGKYMGLLAGKGKVTGPLRRQALKYKGKLSRLDKRIKDLKAAKPEDAAAIAGWREDLAKLKSRYKNMNVRYTENIAAPLLKENLKINATRLATLGLLGLGMNQMDYGQPK